MAHIMLYYVFVVFSHKQSYLMNVVAEYVSSLSYA